MKGVFRVFFVSVCCVLLSSCGGSKKDEKALINLYTALGGF